MTLSNAPGFVLFHVPHDSTWIPPEVRSQFLLDNTELAAEVVKMTDHLTMELFTSSIPENQVVRAEVSRLVVDVERFDDPSEVMLERGMGVVYSRTATGAGQHIVDLPTWPMQSSISMVVRS